MNADEVQLLLAAPAASGGYTAPGSVYNSNGKWCSTTQVNADTTQNNLFPDVTGPENAASQVDYQCVFIYNTDDTTTIANVWAWIPASSVAGPLDWAVGADANGATPYNQSGAVQAGYITAPTIAPSTVSAFYGPSSAASGGAQVSAIGPGQVAAVWVRRTATDSGAYTGDTFNLQITFDVTS
jgi:hypothetical protein